MRAYLRGKGKLGLGRSSKQIGWFRSCPAVRPTVHVPLTHQQSLNLRMLFKAIKSLYRFADIRQRIHKVCISNPLFRIRVEELVWYVLVPLLLFGE